MLNEVITFFGADAKVGTSMIAQSVAEELAAKKKNVLLIFASQELFDEFLNTEDNHTSIDDIHLTDPAKLTFNDMEHIIQKTGTFDYIKGCVRPTELRFYHEDILKSIITLVQKRYDYVIIDGGHNYQYPLPVYSLLVATKRVYVVTQDYKTIARFNSTVKTILAADALKTLASEEIVLNRYNKNDGIYSAENIKEIFELPITLVPRAKGGASCEANHQTLSRVDRGFKAAIAELTNRLTNGG